MSPEYAIRPRDKWCHRVRWYAWMSHFLFEKNGCTMLISGECGVAAGITGAEVQGRKAWITARS
jgi:hypothetical protein